MRFAPIFAGVLFLAACGKPPERDDQEASSFPSSELKEEAPPSAPGIAPTAAPGVAFNYRYAFRLPSARIAAVQEQHAQACEKLGLDRCRITGMRYRLLNERDVSAMLAFKLDPAIARQFGKQGIEAVDKAQGMLVDSEISGVDAGSAIAAANRNEGQLKDDLARIDGQLGRPGVSAEERAQLTSEAAQLRQSIRSNQLTRDEQKASLATTPMTFQYGSGEIVPGFDAQSPLRNALEQGGRNLIGAIAFLIILVATLLPWVLLILLGLFSVVRFGPRVKRLLGLSSADG